jgi:hypothetical protein
MSRPIRPALALLSFVLLAVGSSAAPGPPPAQESPRALLARAMAAAGGAEKLARYPAFVWHGKAVVHAGEREIRLQGTWKLQPPDVSIVETYEVERGPSSLRKMILTADGGWGERDGARQPLPADMVTHERDQFYLYYVMRLAPLQSPPFELSTLPGEAAGAAGLKVKAPGRPDVDLFFDAAGSLTRLRTRIRKPGATEEVLEELRFDGFVEGEGIRWPRAIRITWDGKPYFDLELTDFTPLPALRDPLLDAPPPVSTPAPSPPAVPRHGGL